MIMNIELPIWAVVANVVYQREVGEEHERRPGTRHFASGTKVYVVHTRSPEEVEVVGMARTSHRWISIWTRPLYLANVRVEMVYSPKTATLLNRKARRIWDGSEESKREAERIALAMQNRSAGTQEFRHEARSENSQ